MYACVFLYLKLRAPYRTVAAAFCLLSFASLVMFADDRAIWAPINPNNLSPMRDGDLFRCSWQLLPALWCRFSLVAWSFYELLLILEENERFKVLNVWWSLPWWRRKSRFLFSVGVMQWSWTFFFSDTEN